MVYLVLDVRRSLRYYLEHGVPIFYDYDIFNIQVHIYMLNSKGVSSRNVEVKIRNCSMDVGELRHDHICSDPDS